ncbi:hypothetical protein HPC49_29570 [Pyxidicoccus fallax]|uniref:Tetratricopeptide repeat protein n=1 Tax=Pyxidicoccus fallax TaxID=394095 RepID=A0A848L6Z8_9BACT|nr:hypothetical protein [Pyxidicoccus fallax]NMO14750.1 hypothetical protein [Pyxidicoccus fallax]NPC82357.1 hypothetical protein [Pyxidicoccus fallax]
MSSHPSPQELRRKWKAANAEPAGSPQRLAAYRELAESCPAFVPNLLALGRAMRLDREQVADPAAYLAETERVIQTAVDVSAGAPEPLIEQGHFLDTLKNSPAEAEQAFASAANAALGLLEEAYVGWIRVLGQQGRVDEATEIAERAKRHLPDSSAIDEALRFAVSGSHR